MNEKYKRGISLIVLAITIIVILILAGAAILSLSKNNPITQANKAVFLSDVRNFQHELSMYETGEFANKIGAYDPKLLQADETQATYDGNLIAGITMNDLISSLGRTTKYAGQFKVVDGELVYQGSNNNEQNWSTEIGVKVMDAGGPTVTIIPPADTLVGQGANIVYTIKFTSNAAITAVDLTGKVELLDNNGVALVPQPNIIIGTVSGTNADAIRQVDVTIDTSALANGSYKLKIKAGSVTDSNNTSNSQDTISLIGFDVDNTAPTNPTIEANPSTWTNGNVTVTITYSGDTVTKEYSIDGLIWNAYTVPVEVTDNGVTVYARGKNSIGNESGVATLTVNNIDRDAPTVEYGTNGATNVQTASTLVTVTDVGTSDIDDSSLQYVWDTQNTTTPASGWIGFTSGSTLTKNSVTGTYYLWVKAADNVGNMVISKTNSFSIDNTAPENPTMSVNPESPTNGNVAITIAYSAETATKEYSLDGINWSSYTSPVPVTNNGVTVYARGKDATGNISGVATLTVNNIDRDIPTVAYGTNGASNVKTASTTVTVTDVGISDINESTFQYVWDTQNTATPSSGWTAFTNGSLVTKTSVTGTYYLWVKASDNVGNMVISKTNSFVIDNTAPENPIMSASPSTWTNGNVAVTITYPAETVTKEYSLDGTNWNSYTSPVSVTNNGVTVYARGKDITENISGVATLTVNNIDKELPTVAYGTNGATNVQTASTTVTVSDTGGSGVNAATLQYVWDIQNTTTPSSGWAIFTSGNTLTKTSVTGTYYLWIKATDNAGNITVSKTNAFGIDNTVPTNPTMSASPSTWTNGNVTVTITYSADSAVKEYSTDATTWSTYTTGVVVTTNNTTVYARGKDVSGNISGQSSLTVTIIDKVLPTIAYGTNGASNVKTASTTVTVTDVSGSGVNAATLQYVWDTQNTTTPTAGWAAFASGNTLTKGSVTGIYYLWIKASDNVGNSTVSKTNAFDIDNTVPANPTMSASPSTWTNGNVTVTINYSADSTIKEYSTNGTTWSTYTTGVVVTTNNTTVYARGKDSSGNISGQSSLAVTIIDKVLPTVAYGTNGASNVQTASTTVTVSDTGGSNLNTSTLQYVWDTQNVTAPSSGWTAFASGNTITKGSVNGTYYLWIKASDNAGNTVTSKTNAFTLVQPIAANQPVLPNGMTAKKWNGSSWDTVASPSTDTTWYNYDTKQWANAQTADGSMWVWIPRYEYKITTTHSSTAQTIAVKFLADVDTTPTSGYTIHPAFTFGTTELTGMWVAKFEASGTTGAIDIKPGAVALKNTMLEGMFVSSKNMQTNSRYGWGTSGTNIDTHLMKNTEWGAVAYLSQSTYGKNSEIWINPNSNYIFRRCGRSFSDTNKLRTVTS